MSLKEFDAKQFMLEKGERVGLIVAVSLMVIMLILSLFMPKKGFLGDSPKEKASALNNDTKTLDNSLRTKQPGEKDLPEKREGRLIDIDTTYLLADNYAPAGLFFEPRIRENPARRPPKIYNVDEAIVAVALVPIDSYLFDRDFQKIWVLVDQAGRRSASGTGTGGFNPFLQMSKGAGGMGMAGGAGMAGGGGMMGMRGGMNPMIQQQMRGFSNIQQGARNLAGATDSQEYTAIQIPIANWNPQELTAHQVRPLRMAIIAGSFPYKAQLEEHKNKLRLASTDAVRSEEVDTKDGKKAESFRFLGIEVQRKEVDADGNTLVDWALLDLAKWYQMWLKHTWVPFQQEDEKIVQVRFNGLAMPLLREFRASQVSTPGVPQMTQLMAMMGKLQPQPGAAQPARAGADQAATGEEQTHYPKVVDSLPKLQATIAELNKEQTPLIAAPKQKSPTLLDPFSNNPEAVITTEQPQQPSAADLAKQNAAQEYIPEHVLARAVDVSVVPGKHYRYRMRIKMANPNYKRSDVASPEYKVHETLESKDWFEIKQTVHMPPEIRYYVVDEKQGATKSDIIAITRGNSAQSDLWKENPKSDQVVMQFQRWVESTQRSRTDSDLVYVGEWTVADRVPVSRGEYVGRKVKVDLPIWVYTRNSFILPAEKQSRRALRVKTGIDVDFGAENPENNLILVDFEGGKVSSATSKVVDNTALEVLMLAPDGKLVSHNNIQDTNDRERKDRREEVLKRIQEVREGGSK